MCFLFFTKEFQREGNCCEDNNGAEDEDKRAIALGEPFDVMVEAIDAKRNEDYKYEDTKCTAERSNHFVVSCHSLFEIRNALICGGFYLFNLAI